MRSVNIPGMVYSLVLLSIIGLFFWMFRVHEITMTSRQIQSQIDSRLPFSQNDISINSMKVDLKENKIHLTVEASGQKLGQSFSVTASTTGEVRFETNTGEFFFEPQGIKISSLRLNDKKISENVTKAIDAFATKEEVKSQKSFFGNLIEVRLNGKRISDKANAILDKLVDKSIDKKEFIGKKIESMVLSLLEKSAKAFLQNLPMYKLSGDLKSTTARMMITSVEVGNDSVIVSLSLGQFISNLIFGLITTLVSLLLVILFTMFSN